MKRIALILGALVLFTNASSCQKAEKDNNPQEKRLYRFDAGLPETKVYFGEVADGHYPLYWKEGDEVRMFSKSAQGDAFNDLGTIPVVPSADGKRASFTFESSLPAGTLLAVASPASSIAGIVGSALSIKMPDEQTPQAGSPDPNAIVMLSSAVIPSEPSTPVQLSFKSISAYGRLSLEGLSVTPKKVFLTSSVEDGPTLTLNTSATKDIFFAWKNVNLGGSKLTVSVLSESGTVSKTITLPPEVAFKSGVVARFSVDMSEAVPSKVPVFDEDNIVFSFGAISDTHINSTTNAYAQKLVNALNQMKAKASEKDPDGLDAVVVAGDLTDQPSATATQILYFKQLYEQVLDPTKVPMIYTVGNHDANPSYWWTANTVAQAKVMQTGLGDNYFTFDLDQDNRKNFECRDCLVDGYHVLSVTPNSCNPVDYDLNVKTWLDNRLKAITEAEPEKFVIVNTHPMIENTVYGSLLGTPMGKAISDIWQSGDTWATRTISDVLAKYPQVVTFSGHL
ncbi:MAG: metallophosphoesterase, partial [Bacteroidales bacterium]|nr:metallophosphoesterase [Bacteroidales bacterium]